MLRRLIEEANVQMHAFVLETLVLNRMIVHVDRLKALSLPDADVVDEQGRILYEDRVLEPYYPVVETIVHLSSRTSLEFEVNKDLPLMVDIVGWVQRLLSVAPSLKSRQQQCEFMLTVQWVVLCWAQCVDGDVAMKLITNKPSLNACKWWKVMQTLQSAWRTEGRMVWTATPTSSEVIIDAHLYSAQTLARLLAHRFVLWCC